MDVKQFLIPGSPTDYYVVLKNENGVTEHSALRGKIRQLVDVYSECINDVIQSGGNPHIASLDYLDVMKEFLSNEPAEAQAAILEVYSQEVNAAASTVMDKTIELNEDADKRNSGAVVVGQFIGVMLLLIIVAAFLFR